jgi:LuxR family maltose regulon positive regulatory protein
VGTVVASAGSGKSVLVAQWAESLRGCTVATLTLQPHHNDAHVFAAGLLDALREAGVQLEPGAEDLLETGGRALGEAFLERVLIELEHLDVDVVLVLDDAHVLSNVALLDELDHLLHELPARARVLVAARWDPTLQLRRLRMEGRLVEVRADELAFDETEGAELLRLVSDRELDDDQTATLVERTDGWAAGLQLAGISLRSGVDTATFVESFAGTDRLVIEYLTEEVLDTLDGPTRDFLLCTSVVPWFDAALADELTGRSDGLEQLERLQRRSLFLVALDRPGRFRYHHLFADLLRYRLRAERGPMAAPDLRRRAAAWYELEGHAPEAIEQLLAVRDAGAAWRVVHSVARRMFELGRTGTLVEWLTRIAEIQVPLTAEVQIDLLAAQCAANRFVLAAETHEQLRRREDLRPGQAVAVATLGSVLGLDRLPPEVVRSATQEVLEALPSIEPAEVTDFLGVGGTHSVEVMASFMSGVGHLHGSDVLAATDVFDSLVDLPGAQYPVWRVHLLGGRALARLWSGHLRSARALAAAAVEAAEEAGLSQHMASTAAHSALTGVSLDHRDVATAAQQVREFEVRALRHRGATFTELHRLQVARLTAFVEGPGAALDELDRTTTGPPTSVLLDRSEQVLRIRLLLEAGEVEAARSAAISTGGLAAASGARVDVELARGDVGAARWQLDRWSPTPGDLADEVARLVGAAAVLRAEAREEAAVECWHTALVRAQPEDLRQPFLEHPDLLHALRVDPPATARRFVTTLLESVQVADARRSGQDRLVEALTERELALLDLLPTRLSNRELATRLYVSVNTVKTHLRNIYRKLGVADRDAAIVRATELGLL